MKGHYKLITLTIFLMTISYFVGGFVANYRWLNTYFFDSMASGEQNSVKYSLVYMEKYMEGDPEGAHKWIQNHSLFDPEWILLTDEQSVFGDALSLSFELSNNNLLSRIKEARLKDLQDIEQRQNNVREFISASKPE